MTSCLRDSAQETLPHAVVDTLPDVSRHMIPFSRPQTPNKKLTEFFTGPTLD